MPRVRQQYCTLTKCNTQFYYQFHRYNLTAFVTRLRDIKNNFTLKNSFVSQYMLKEYEVLFYKANNCSENNST